MGKKNGSELTDKQAAFVRFYLISLSATDAALKAGYSEKNPGESGYALLQKPSIRLAIKKAKEARAKRLEISAENVLRELARIGFADIKHTSVWDPDIGLIVKPSDEIDEDTSAAISEITESKTVIKGKRGDGDQVNTTLKVKLHDKVKALDLIGRHVGLFKESGRDGGDAVPITLGYLPKSEREEK